MIYLIPLRTYSGTYSGAAADTPPLKRDTLTRYSIGWYVRLLVKNKSQTRCRCRPCRDCATLYDRRDTFFRACDVVLPPQIHTNHSEDVTTTGVIAPNTIVSYLPRKERWFIISHTQSSIDLRTGLGPSGILSDLFSSAFSTGPSGMDQQGMHKHNLSPPSRRQSDA